MKACAKSSHTDGLAHPFLFGWFGDISSAVAVQKLAISIWLLSITTSKVADVSKSSCKITQKQKTNTQNNQNELLPPYPLRVLPPLSMSRSVAAPTQHDAAAPYDPMLGVCSRVWRDAMVGSPVRRAE